MSPSGKSPAILRVAALLSAVLALARGYWLAEHLPGKTPERSGLHATVFREPRAIEPFARVDHTGKHFDNRHMGVS